MHGDAASSERTRAFFANFFPSLLGTSFHNLRAEFETVMTFSYFLRIFFPFFRSVLAQRFCQLFGVVSL